ncbi:hypothetical protein BU16DRAFT_15568 [Lophium mytilinum]|uniref:F-box domain-containing protein n=1 Tax=Lophium mytilinum TaxID=390894 RepID=A0A6A6RCM7_9PEZI|nr:hypothetical protein BU16DRAFT_15568 [Lophium mytilinum]
MDSTNRTALYLREQIVAVCRFPGLKRLQLACNDISIVPLTHNAYTADDERWTTAITHIKQLDLRVMYSSGQDTSQLAKSIAIFISSANELEVLHLRWTQDSEDEEGCHDILKNLEQRIFPSLQEVSLSKSFTTAQSLYDLLHRHKSSIRSISLRDMYMRPSIGSGDWNSVLRELPGIVDLEKISLWNLWEIYRDSKTRVTELEMYEPWILACCQSKRDGLSMPVYSEWLQNHRATNDTASDPTAPTTPPGKD